MLLSKVIALIERLENLLVEPWVVALTIYFLRIPLLEASNVRVVVSVQHIERDYVGRVPVVANLADELEILISE
jgi:hypothetical protein